LEFSSDRKLIQDYRTTKKVSPFLIMNYQRYFSLVLALNLRVNLLTLSVVNNYSQLVDNLNINTGFQ
jgi:hypothetical protein